MEKKKKSTFKNVPVSVRKVLLLLLPEIAVPNRFPDSLNKYITFSDTSFTCHMLSFGKLVVNSVHFLLTENIKKGN